MKNYPAAFTKLLSSSLPEDEVAPLLDSLEWAPLTSIRLNPSKKHPVKHEFQPIQVPWCADGYILNHRPLFTEDPAFHCGLYYVQEASSMIVGEIVKDLIKDLSAPAAILDLCAAPGGKSTHISSSLRKGDILVANEVIHSRTPILSENLNKWGDARHIITRADSAAFRDRENLFDIVVADLPCSGEGMFRKDPDAVNEWSIENVDLCSLRQKRIVRDVWNTLKPGGYLIYSTCTLNRTENEDNIFQILAEFESELVQFDFSRIDGIYEIESGMYRLLPHRSPGEGFFFSVIRKPLTPITQSRKQQGSKKYRILRQTPLPLSSEYTVIQEKDQCYVMNGYGAESTVDLLSTLPEVYVPGTPVCQILSGKKIIYKLHSNICLLSGNSDHELIPEYQVDDREIMQYLQKATLIAKDYYEKGLLRIIWKGISVGLANHTGKTLNNLWPGEWRIRKQLDSATSILQLP